MRLIDADALMAEWNKCNLEIPITKGRRGMNIVTCALHNVRQLTALIEGAPAIEAEPVKHGRWIDENCSVCGQYVYHGDAQNYCPNCGAKMEDENDRSE